MPRGLYNTSKGSGDRKQTEGGRGQGRGRGRGGGRGRDGAIRTSTQVASVEESLPIALNIGGSWHSCTCFSPPNLPPLVIDYRTLQPMELPHDWSEKKGMSRAISKTAKDKEFLALHIGFVEFNIKGISEETMKEITEERDGNGGMSTFDCEGEFDNPTGQIPLSGLLDAIEVDDITLGKEDNDLLEALYSLQSPQTSPWSLPHLRIVSNHTYEGDMLNLKFYLWFSRPLFEMIADKCIKIIMDRVQRPVEVIPVQTRPKQPVQFVSSLPPNHDQATYQFSLAGLLKYAESSGYDYSSYIRPTGLAVELFDFQKSTYSWMLDQERMERGLNSFFWEEWKYPSASIFYFPLAGEFRLKRPPHASGGLLCEEMGLGKTVEVIALILGNPASASAPSPITQTSDIATNPLRKTKATLLVLPSNLLVQWWAELHSRVDQGLLSAQGKSFRVINVSNHINNKFRDILIPNCDIRLRSRSSGDILFDWGSIPTQLLVPPLNLDYELEVRVPWAPADQIFKATLSNLKKKFTYATTSCKADTANPTLSPSASSRKGDTTTGPKQWHYYVHLPYLESSFDEYDVVITNYDSLQIQCSGASILKKYDW